MNRSNYWQLLPYIRPQSQTIVKGFVGIIGYVAATLTLIKLVEELSTPFGQGNVLEIAKLAVILGEFKLL